MDSTKVRIFLLGKTGAGKSSAGNTILGRKAFVVSPTTCCQEETTEFKGQPLAVVDTPGLLNSTLTEGQVKTEINRWFSCPAPGPRVFLVVIHAGRFTRADQEVVKIIQQMFGEEALGCTMVLFTRGDDVEADGVKIDKIISDNNDLSDFIRQCHGRYNVFNNRKNDPSQVRDLLENINALVKDKKGRDNTNEMFKQSGKDNGEEKKQSQRENPQIQESKKQARMDRGFNQTNQHSGRAAAFGGAAKAGIEELRIVLVGKTGVGKSSAGNTILRKRVFQSSPSATTKCQKEEGEFEGQKLAVVDTPGLLNTRLSEEQVMEQISRCISLAAPGPHVILVVLQGGRFIEEDQEIVNNINRMLGKGAACFTMVLFTCGDDLKADGDTIEEILTRDTALRNYIEHCNNNYQLFENRDKDPGQVRDLLKMINEIVENNERKYYTTEMFREAERGIQEEMRRQKESCDMMYGEDRRQSFYKGSYVTTAPREKRENKHCFIL